MKAKLTDVNGEWVGGEDILVQVGDILDRGDQSRKVLDLLMNLEEKAKNVGGRVVFLLGNHEVMNLIGDLRFLSKNELSQYTTPPDYHQLKSFVDFLDINHGKAYYDGLREGLSSKGIREYFQPGEKEPKVH